MWLHKSDKRGVAVDIMVMTVPRVPLLYMAGALYYRIYASYRRLRFFYVKVLVRILILREGPRSQGASWVVCGSGVPPYDFLNLYGISNSRFCISFS
jgi:hypothetical protein